MNVLEHNMILTCSIRAKSDQNMVSKQNKLEIRFFFFLLRDKAMENIAKLSYLIPIMTINFLDINYFKNQIK